MPEIISKSLEDFLSQLESATDLAKEERVDINKVVETYKKILSLAKEKNAKQL